MQARCQERQHVRGARPPRRFAATALASTALLGAVVSGCGTEGTSVTQERLVVQVTTVNGTPTPLPAPLAPNLGDVEEEWAFTVQALDENGQPDTGYNSFVRVSLRPGAVNRVVGNGADGRNIRLAGGWAEGTAFVTAMFGPSRLWVEDMGYEPAPPGVVPTCANGVDDDGDVAVDHPNDPGCAFADDMTEDPGKLLTAVSKAVNYALPAIADVQGRGSRTPYASVSMQIDAASPRYVVVTRVSSNGFFLTDLADQATGFNHIFAYNYNTPEGMRVCDKVTHLSGTASEFFGFTEISFPSYEVNYLNAQGQVFGPADCQVPEPTLLEPPGDFLDSPAEMEKHESGLVRIENFIVADWIGAERAVLNAFGPNKSNCDLNEDGAIDYFDEQESSCSNACADEPRCAEWVNFSSWGAFKMYRGMDMVRVSTTTAFGFDPMAHKGQAIPSVTGTLRNFSGGSLNWTIETRCIDDLVCDYEGCPRPKWPASEAPDPPDQHCSDCTACPEPCVEDCTEEPCGWVCPQAVQIPSRCACSTLRTEVDNDAATY